MGQPANARLTPEITREVCQRTGSTTALDGSIARIGTRYNVILKAVNCVDGDLLASTEAQAVDKSHVLDALGDVASEMRKRLGESLSTVQKYNTPLEQATTPSLEALQAYSLGFQNWRGGKNIATLPFFERAIQLDPKFAMAFWAIGTAYAYLGETALSSENMRKAFALRAGVSQRERMVIETDYYNFVTGDLRKARGVCEIGARTYPHDFFFHLDLGGFANSFGEYESGLEEYLKALRLDPYNSILYRMVVYTYLLSGQVARAEATAAEAQAKGLGFDLAPILYEIAFYHGDTAQMGRELARAGNKPGGEDLLLALQADTAAYFGHLKQAQKLSREAAESAERAGEEETAAGYRAVSALREALFGNKASARQQVVIGRKHSVGRDTDYGFALALVYAAETGGAQALTDDLSKRFPEDSGMQLSYLPTLRKVGARRCKSSAGP